MGVSPRQRLGAPLKREAAASLVRDMIADGTLKPGATAPSGAALAAAAGCGVLTAQKALRSLLAAGTLVPGASQGARLRVAGAPPDGGAFPQAPRLALSAALAARRHAEGLKQPELATLLGVSVTTVGHAETARLWQSRDFWQHADLILGTGGELTGLYDDMQASAAAPAPGGTAPFTPGIALTAAERCAVRLAGELYTLIADDVVAPGTTREDDLAELRSHVHAIQNMVKAQAAGRACPLEFRLLGSTLPDAAPVVPGEGPEG